MRTTNADIIRRCVMFSLIALGACEPSESHQSEQNRKQPAPNYSVARSTEPSLLPQDIVRAELAFNTRNMNKAVEFMVDQAVMLERSSDVQPIVGKANIQRHMEELVRAFPDATVTPYRIMGGNQWILSETHLHGSQSQPLGSLENNGRRFDVRGAKLYRVQAGHIVETRIYMDTPTVLKQLLQPRGLSVERTPRPNLLEPEMPTGPPDAELERRFVGFVKAWTSHSQRRVDQLVAHDIRFHNHAWHHEGHGLRRFMKEGAPLPWPLTHRGLDIVSTLSTGEWVAGEVLISGRLSLLKGDERVQKRVRLPLLVVTRFEGDRVQQVDIYGNTLAIRKSFFGEKLFANGPTTDEGTLQ